MLQLFTPCDRHQGRKQQCSHQYVCQIVFAIVCSMFLSLPIHRQSVVVVFRVPLLENKPCVTPQYALT